MNLIMFSKAFKNKGIGELIKTAKECGAGGFDLCVRPGYPVSPDNAGEKLVEAANMFSRESLSVPMVTGNFDLLASDHPTAKPILSAMDRAGVRLIKLGYFHFDPVTQDYWEEVDKIRRILEGWQKLAKEYSVKVCYHVHSCRCMGLNCSALAHLVNGFDPACIGAYIDPGHMVVEGEEFSVGAAIVRKHLSIVALKDVLLVREEKNGHGRVVPRWVPAGKGMVDWTAVFAELARIGFDGPLSVHCEFEVPEQEFSGAVKQEVSFFRFRHQRINERWCGITP